MPVRLCVHGHFYQPPRDNPWLGSVPAQPSAAPFHDWNERITAECYRPNGGARVLDGRGEVIHRVNNYAHISFDVGPTLLRWMDVHAPDVVGAMVAADRAGIARWGHGGAMAHGYHHTILPLDSPRDRTTQIRWAIADFRHRFGREPAGFWMPECAVDTATLGDLAAAGIRFTVVAPNQIHEGGNPNAGPFRVSLPTGDEIALYAYDGSLSQAVAFERLLDDGDRFFERARAAADGVDGPVSIATDGESYGHHHRLGEMALAWFIERAQADPTVRMWPYAADLAAHPPTRAGRIREGSSWSCAHGVARWCDDCGCGTEPGGGAWRAPLRSALDSLRDRIDTLTQAREAHRFTDVWAARDDWVRVLLDRDAWPDWGRRWVRRPEDLHRASDLMALHENRLAAFTSCAWFFEDVARLEPEHNLACAWRACELGEALWPDIDLRSPFHAHLGRVHSNRADAGSAADLLDRRVLPTIPT